jgi:hypothetical protein
MNDETIKKMRQFYKRWNIKVDEGCAFDAFKNRVINILEDFIVICPAVEELDSIFSSLAGKHYKYSPTDLKKRTDFLVYGPRSTQMYEVLNKAQSSEALAQAIQWVFLALDKIPVPKGSESNHSLVTEGLFTSIAKAIEMPPSIDIRLVRSGKEISVYPVGAKLLDESLVNDVLAWLVDYPKVCKDFEEALSIYRTKDRRKYRNMIDNLRTAVEELLRTILGKPQSLENQGKELVKWLKSKSVQPHLRTMLTTYLIHDFCNLQNDVAKHGEKTLSDPEIEMLLYQTGVFLRFLLRLHSCPEVPATQ